MHFRFYFLMQKSRFRGRSRCMGKFSFSYTRLHAFKPSEWKLRTKKLRHCDEGSDVDENNHSTNIEVTVLPANALNEPESVQGQKIIQLCCILPSLTSLIIECYSNTNCELEKSHSLA